MGIAAYNRGSRAIAEQIRREYEERHTRVVWTGPAQVAPKPPADPLPEGRLRSSYLPEGEANGTALFLNYEKRWYVVSTRFQIFARRRKLADAAKLFERLELYGLCALERI
jgi:hypothetical protein